MSYFCNIKGQPRQARWLRTNLTFYNQISEFFLLLQYVSNQDLIYLVFILNPFLKMNSISSFDFTTTSWTRLLQSPSSNSSTKAPCFSNARMNPLNNSLWAFLLSICSEILSYFDLMVLYLSVRSAYLLSYSFWSSAVRLFSAMAVCICSTLIIHYAPHK